MGTTTAGGMDKWTEKSEKSEREGKGESSLIFFQTWLAHLLQFNVAGKQVYGMDDIEAIFFSSLPILVAYRSASNPGRGSTMPTIPPTTTTSELKVNE